MLSSHYYEVDDETFSADAYQTLCDNTDVAWHVLGWETEPDADTYWSGYEVRTGRVVLVMVGDDRHFSYDLEDIAPLEREEYCGVCGQIRCGHDGLDRE